jgi:hypothetical protein
MDQGMPALEINPTVRIQAGPYAAEISPSAGGRLLSLTYAEANQALDCIVPWQGHDAFEAHDWPKAGAFEQRFALRARTAWFRASAALAAAPEHSAQRRTRADAHGLRCRVAMAFCSDSDLPTQ